MFYSYDGIMSPDFSICVDWPFALNIWNHYRKHYIAAYCQLKGVRVIPSICWIGKDSFDWCFDGEPVGGCVAVSSVGTQLQTGCQSGFLYGYDAMLERLQPEIIFFNGTVPSECRGNIVQIEAFQNRLRNRVEKERDI